MAMTVPLVTNIGAPGRRQRYVMGAIGLVLTLVLAAGFAVFGVARGARLVLFVPLLVAGLGFFQARGGT